MAIDKENKTLQEILSQFQGANGNEDSLQAQFYEFAKYFTRKCPIFLLTPSI